MKLTPLFILILTATATAQPASAADCERQLEGGQSLHKLVETIVRDSFDKMTAYRLKISAKRMVAEDLRGLTQVASAISRFGATFRLIEISASKSNLIFEFEISGPGRNVVQGLMELSSRKTPLESGLDTVMWQEINRAHAPGVEAQNNVVQMKISDLDLDLSVRIRRALFEANIKYVGDLLIQTEAELLDIPDLGPRSLEEIKETLATLGLHLTPEI